MLAKSKTITKMQKEILMDLWDLWRHPPEHYLYMEIEKKKVEGSDKRYFPNNREIADHARDTIYKVRNVMNTLERKELVYRLKNTGRIAYWGITKEGLRIINKMEDKIDDMDHYTSKYNKP